MRISEAISLVCSVSVLSLVAILFMAGCGFRVSTSDFPVFKLSDAPETKTAQNAERVIGLSTADLARKRN
jgi:hypothetical protein